MTPLKQFISKLSVKIKTAFGSDKNISEPESNPEIIETVNRLKQASNYNCDIARLLDNYKTNKTDFRITLKRGTEIKSLKDLDEIKEKYDLSSVE